MTSGVLTDELLASAERIYRMTVAEGEARGSVYDGKSGPLRTLSGGGPRRTRRSG